MKSLIIFLLFSIQIFTQPYRDSHQYVSLDFSEPMDKESLKPIFNYVCYSENGDTLIIYKVYLPKDTIDIMQVALETDQFEHDLEYIVKAYWVKDLAGNLINENNLAWVILPLVDSTLYKPQVVEIIKN